MAWTEAEINGLVLKQREFFLTNQTLSVKWRIAQLKRLKAAVIKHEPLLEKALEQDLGRSAVEAYICDIGTTISEINEIIAGLRRWARPERHFSGLLCFPSIFTRVYKMPYGVTLIMSPFNFPILLSLGVLAASIAGGNTAILKTSSKSSACTEAMKALISETFLPEYVSLIDGGHDVSDMCLAQRFDKIFYTGSPKVAKHVMAEAAKNLTPVALELGGETGNWCIVRADADLKDAARKIAFFKSLNAGQICININQVAVAAEVADKFIAELKNAFDKQLGEPLTNAEYPRMIDDRTFGKCTGLVQEYQERIVHGGNGDEKSLRFEPTIIYPVNIDEGIVQQELFCPILPVVPFNDSKVEELLATISRREHPLAMYVFTGCRRWARQVMSTMQYGGGCINEVCVHLMVKGVPFGGTGHSGMGAYHGIWGFREFTHPQTVLHGSSHFNLSIREHPYGGKFSRIRLAILKLLER